MLWDKIKDYDFDSVEDFFSTVTERELYTYFWPKQIQAIKDRYGKEILKESSSNDNKGCEIGEQSDRIIRVIKEEIENHFNERVDYYTQDDGDEYDIVKVTPDEYHRYERVDGILYELSLDGGDKVVHVDDIEHTEGNLFYDDQTKRYIKYLENGGALESFPVNEGQLGGAYTLEEMCDYLAESENFDLMYDLVNVKDSKAHTSLYDAIDSLSYDSESYGIEGSVLSKIRNVADLDKYYGKDYLSQFDEEEIEDYSYYWEPEYYNGFKRILEYWEGEKEYTLTDMNHRFTAVKALGVKRVYVDPS